MSKETLPKDVEFLIPTPENLEAEFYIACMSRENTENEVEYQQGTDLIHAILDCYIDLGYLAVRA